MILEKRPKELRTEDLGFPVKGNSKCKRFKMRKGGILVVLEHSECEAWWKMRLEGEVGCRLPRTK